MPGVYPKPALPRVLFVSKPVARPFHDGSQVLVRELANHLTRFRPHVMGTEDRVGFESHVQVDALYARRGTFAPGMVQNIRPLLRLLTGDAGDVWHFVFAPNARSCRVIQAVRRVRRRPSVQTIASPPRNFADVDRLLFGDVVVAQSHWTANRIRQHARGTQRIEVIRPPVGPLTEPTTQELAHVRQLLRLEARHEVVVYPGDLEFSQGAERVAAVVESLVKQRPNALVVFACRRKTQAAVEAEARLLARLNPESTRFVGEVPSLCALYALTKVVVFPVEDLYAKVDIPIALLEAMQLGVSLVVPTEGPVSELSEAIQVPASDSAAWVTAISELLHSDSRRTQVAAGQRQQMATDFDASSVAARYEALYTQLLEG